MSGNEADLGGNIPEGEGVGMNGGKRSAWMSHVKKTMKANKGKSLSQVLKMASKTFKKSKRGGGALTPASATGGDMGGAPAGAATVGGRRRRGSRKTRKGTRGSRKH